MNPRYRKVMARAMGFGMRPVLQRYALANQVSLEEVELLERELKRHLVLRVLRPWKRYGMVGPADDLWHMFIVSTRLYARFCARVAGQFIHHKPPDPEDRDWPQRFKKHYATFWKDYEAVFGEPPPDSTWPSVAMLSHCRFATLPARNEEGQSR